MTDYLLHKILLHQPFFLTYWCSYEEKKSIQTHENIYTIQEHTWPYLPFFYLCLLSASFLLLCFLSCFLLVLLSHHQTQGWMTNTHLQLTYYILYISHSDDNVASCFHTLVHTRSPKHMLNHSADNKLISLTWLKNNRKWFFCCHFPLFWACVKVCLFLIDLLLS